MKAFVSLLCLVALMLVNGCASTQPSRDLIVPRLQDIRAGEIPPRIDQIGLGDTPAYYIYMQGHAGEQVTVQIRELSSGTIIEKQMLKVSPGPEHFPSSRKLHAGSYRAELIHSGSMIDSAKFNVYK